MSTILNNVDLSHLTAFGVGGLAETYINIKSAQGFKSLIPHIKLPTDWWVLGLATNSLISDKGLGGLVIHLTDGQIINHGLDVIADGGASWDKLVEFTVSKDLWGIELMSGIPGTVGGAAAININAYGQALSDVLNWVEIYEPKTNRFSIVKFKPEDWSYKCSPFVDQKIIITRICLSLSRDLTKNLTYSTALECANEYHLNPNYLQDRRQIILKTRSQAGSLLDDKNKSKTCGSFFKNPLVHPKQLNELLTFDEKINNLDVLKQMNIVHGGQANRISAAHVLLAAGFKRGQAFGRVRLHPDHVLKIENYKSASAKEIYQVAKHIQKIVKMRLKIDLEFEVNLFGDFD